MPTGTQRAVEVLGQLDAAIAALAELPAAEIDGLHLIDGISRLLDAETRLRGVQAGWLAVAETTDAVVAATGRSARSWLVEELKCGGGDAGRRLRVARGLADRPTLRDAVGTARITVEQADAVLHALREVPTEHHDAIETALVGIAAEGSLRDVHRAVDEVAARIGGETAEQRAGRRYADRGVQLDETFAGTGSLSGTLSSECRETLRLALHAAGGVPGPDDTRTAGQRRHDALADIATFYLAHADTAAPEAGERPRIVVTIGYDQLRQTLDTDHAASGTGALLRAGTFDSGAPVTTATVRRMACDAQVIPVVLGGSGEVLDLGRTTRTFSLAIRRAAKLRDGAGCARHGCTRPITDCHHITWWTHGGPSNLDNAVWLCTFHHWLVHEGGWTLRRHTPGRYTFTDPHGRDHGPPPASNDPPTPGRAA